MFFIDVPCMFVQNSYQLLASLMNGQSAFKYYSVSKACLLIKQKTMCDYLFLFDNIHL